MNKMSIVALNILALLVNNVFAYDGSQDVNGVTWYYNRVKNVNGGCSASIDSKDSGGKSYSGALTIPMELDGCTVVEIGRLAFRGCKGLTTVMIPSSVTNIGWRAFESCSGLTSFSVADGNPNYKSINGLLCSKDGGILIAGINGDAVIPSSVTCIGDDAFCGCSGLTSVTIPPSVTTIGKSAFGGCRGLTSVTIPPSVKAIGDWAFDGCSGLTSVVIPPSVTAIGRSTFANCECLRSVTIPSSVTSIGERAFAWCEALTSVTIPSSVTSIGEAAFERCEALTSVNIPDSVTAIGTQAFGQCDRLTSVKIDKARRLLEESGFYLPVSHENVVLTSSCDRFNSSDSQEAAVSTSSDDTRKAVAVALLKAMIEAQQAQRESTRQSQPRLNPGIAAMMNWKPPCSSSSSSRSSSSDSLWPSWKCRYCGSVAYGPAPMPNSGRRCAGRELGPDPGPCVYDKN